jgi:hypothetical protein
MSFLVAGCVLLLALVASIAIEDSASGGRTVLRRGGARREVDPISPTQSVKRFGHSSGRRNFRFRTAAAMATSVASVQSLRDRKTSPKTRSYRPIDASTFGLQIAATGFLPGHAARVGA